MFLSLALNTETPHLSYRADPHSSPLGPQVDLERTFTFRNSKQTYSGIPIIVANMDTVGTFEMAVVMSQVRCGAPRLCGSQCGQVGRSPPWADVLWAWIGV